MIFSYRYLSGAASNVYLGFLAKYFSSMMLVNQAFFMKGFCWRKVI